MASSVSSTSMYNQYGIRNNGIGGLVSGLDTDSLVEALTSGTRSKIAKQGQSKQLLNWKMTAYRNISSAMREFQNKYFSYSSSSATNITSSAFFNTYKSTSSSSKVTVTPGNNAVAGNITIDSITSLAEQQTLTGGVKVSKPLEGSGIDAGTDFTNKTLLLNVAGTVKTIKLDTLNGKSGDDLKQELQDLVTASFGYQGKTDIPVVDVSVTTGADGDVIGFSSSGGNKITISGGDVGDLGFNGGESTRVSLSNKLSTLGLADNLKGENFKFNINGIDFSFNKNATLNDIMSKVNTSTANVTMSYNASTDKFTITAKSGGGGSNNVVVKDTEGNLLNTLMGAQASNSVGSKDLVETTIKGNAFASDPLAFTDANSLKSVLDKISKTNFKMTVDGTTKTINLSLTTDQRKELEKATSTADLKEKLAVVINSSISSQFSTDDVKMKVNSDGSFSVDTSNNHTVSLGIGTISEKQTDALVHVLGFSNGASNALNLGYDNYLSASADFTKDQGEWDDIFSKLATDGGSFLMSINGVTKEVAFKVSPEAAKDAETFMKAVNESVQAAFGSAAKGITLKQAATGELQFAIDSNDASIGGNTKVELARTDTATLDGKLDLFDTMGFGSVDSVTNHTGKGTTLGQMGITGGTFDVNGTPVAYSGTDSLVDFINNINQVAGPGTATFKDGHLTINTGANSLKLSEVSGGSGNALSVLFGVNENGVAYDSSTLSATAVNKDGRNAEITVNGQTMYSSSNTFSINGITIEINALTAADGSEPINIGTSYDSDALAEKLNSFIADYNALIGSINAMLREDKVSGYSPLTDDQKSGMTTEEIAKWESEAKKGLLRNDSTLSSIVNQFRSSLLYKVGNSGISLSDIGITTASLFDSGSSGGISYGNDGQLVLDTDKLKSYIDKNGASAIQVLFTDATDGIAKRINNIVTAAASTNSTNRGTLVQMAGSSILTGNNTSYLGKQIESIDTLITKLTAQLKSEYTRYWNKFSSLETAISKLNSQSSIFNQ